MKKNNKRERTTTKWSASQKTCQPRKNTMIPSKEETTTICDDSHHLDEFEGEKRMGDKTFGQRNHLHCG